MIKKINHIGIIVPNLEEAIELYVSKMGMKLDHVEEAKDFNVKIAFIPCGDVLIELLEPIGAGMSQDFLEKTGGGIHHICYETEDIEAAYEKMNASVGVKNGEGIKTGAGNSRVFFLDPAGIGNVETEFVELP